MNNTTADKQFAKLARIGYASRGVIYLVVGGLALLAAMDHQGGSTTNSKGALRAILSQPLGDALIVTMIIGLLGYSAWRAVQAIKDTDDHGTDIKGLGVRAGLFISSLTHISLATWAADLAMGGGNDSQGWTNNLMTSGWGQIVLAVVGIGFAIVGIAHVFKGWTARFDRYIDFPENINPWARPLCQFGLISRGVVWGILAWFLMYSAWQGRGGEIKGMEDALNLVRTADYGSWLFGILAAGLFAFGIYSILEAFYRRVEVSFD